MRNFSRSIELIANIAIITVAILLSYVLVKRYVFEPGRAEPLVSANQHLRSQKINLSGVDWSKSEKTLVLAISSVCHFCTESAPFYRQLAEAHEGTRLVAVLPQTIEEGKLYLNKLRVNIDEVIQAPLSSIDVNGTPTLMLVDRNGTVIDTWVGRLPAVREAEILAYVKAD